MKSVIILTTFLLLFGVLIFAAPGTPTAGNIRINADTTNTNTESSRVTITQYTNFNSATVTATNWVQVGQSGEDGIITLTSSDTTNSVDITMDSAGQFRIETTTPDSEAAFVLNMSTPHTNGPSLQLQNNGNIIFSINAQSGWTNSGLLFFCDAGYFTNVVGGGGAGITNIFDTIIVTNITFVTTNVNFTTNFYFNGQFITNISQVNGTTINATDGVMPYRLNATNFADSFIQNDAVSSNSLFIMSGGAVAGVNKFGDVTVNRRLQIGSNYVGQSAITGGTNNSNIGVYGVSDFVDDARGRMDLVLQGVADPSAPGSVGKISVLASGNSGDTNIAVTFQATRNTGGLSYGGEWIFNANAWKTNTADNIFKFLQIVGGVSFLPVKIQPTVPDGTTPIILGSGSGAIHSSGDILDIHNSLTNVDTFGWDGTLTVINTSGRTASFGLNAGGNPSISAGGGATAIYLNSQVNIVSEVPQADVTYVSGQIGGNKWASMASAIFYVPFSTGRVYWNNNTNTVFDAAGVGSPEGVVTASPGSTWRNLSGGATNSFWVKETGTASNTGWINK